jgi:hypothetical protein
MGTGDTSLMKTTDAAELVMGAKMKHNASPRNVRAGRSSHSPVRIPHIPMEWMDPMSWRLPSGKALAEFALQAGFLAPLMLGAPKFKPRKIAAAAPAAPVVDNQAEEAPERMGSFRQTR